VSSMLRTVAQQYLLYNWYLDGLCGIQLAATPGNSNHEQGRALDTSDYGTWDGLFSAYGWDWYGSGDVVHFTYNGAGVVDLSGTDVLAFQRLWNRNHPEDLIAEDGDYGPQTGGRLGQSPADGFPVGAEACCGGLDATGLCDGNTLRWCDGGPQTEDCAAEGLVCGFSEAEQAYACLSPCEGIDPAGQCDGDVLQWCDGGPQTEDCAAEGLVCAWAVPEEKNACLPACGDLDATGLCDGDTLRWCEGGAAQSLDCAATETSCLFDEASSRYACLGGPPATDGGAGASGAAIYGIPSSGGCDCRAGGPRGSAPVVLLTLLFACFGRRRSSRAP